MLRSGPIPAPCTTAATPPDKSPVSSLQHLPPFKQNTPYLILKVKKTDQSQCDQHHSITKGRPATPTHTPIQRKGTEFAHLVSVCMS